MPQNTASRIICVALGLVLGLIVESARGQDESPPAGANKMCPVMQDQPTKSSRFVDHQGRRIYFCCEKCVAKFQREPAKYLAVLDGDRAA
jgi:YHS domain-containing protein